MTVLKKIPASVNYSWPIFAPRQPLMLTRYMRYMRYKRPVTFGRTS